MSLVEIQAAVLRALAKAQAFCGRPWTGLDLTAKPIGDLDGFDSPGGVEATLLLEDELGCGDLHVENVFKSKDGKRALNVIEVARRVAELLAAKEARR